MTIHVNIGEAKTRLSELVAASVRGEEVVLAKAGAPQARIVALQERTAEELERRGAKRKAAFGMWKHLVGDQDIIVPPSMTDAELEARWRRKFGPDA